MFLAIAVGIAGFTTIDRHVTNYFSHGLGPVNAQAVVIDQGGFVGDVTFGRYSTIIKPVAIPTAAAPNRKAIRYLVKDGDTLDTISRAAGVSLRDVVWSNPGLRLPLRSGQALVLPPMPGVVAVVKKGDTLSSLTVNYGVDPTTILGFNNLRGGALTPGQVLVIPVDPDVGPNLSSGVPADPMHPGRLMCPIQGAEVIQKFGPTNFALEPSYGGYLHFHTGVDLLADYGTPIVAAAGGRVTGVGWADYYGIRVEVTDSYGLVETYAHMQDTSVSLGQPIQQGQKVGTVGSTGLSIGAHLHLQLEIGGLPTDPLPLIGC